MFQKAQGRHSLYTSPIFKNNYIHATDTTDILVWKRRCSLHKRRGHTADDSTSFLRIQRIPAPRRQLDSIVQSGGNRNRAVRCRIWENMRVAVCLQFRLRVVDPKCRLHAKEEMLATAQLLDWILDGVRPIFAIRLSCRRQPPDVATIDAKPRRT